MRPETIDAVERILDLDSTATEEERAAVADALRGRRPSAGAEPPAVLSAKDAAARLGRTTARVRQLAQAGVLRRGYGGYLAESIDTLLRRGLPRKPRKEQPKRAPRRGARRAGA